MSDDTELEPESYVVVYEDDGTLRTTRPMSHKRAGERAQIMEAIGGTKVLSVMTEDAAEVYLRQAQDSADEPQELQVVLYTDEEGNEAITEPEPALAANERAKEMARNGVKVLRVVDPYYGEKRVTPARDTRVWYRPRGSEDEEDDKFSPLMTYPQAMVRGDSLREKGYTIIGLISQQQFEERTAKAAQELFEGKEPEDPGEPLRRAVERVEKIVTSQAKAREQAGATVPDHQAEGRRYQALELAVKMLTNQMRLSVDARKLVAEAKVIERYLKGTAPRRPQTP